MLDIVQAPHKVLSSKAKKVSKVDSKIKKLIKEMTVTLENTRDPEGVGLAAPQVGESLRLFIIKEDPASPLYVFINPEIISISEEKLPVVDEKKSKEKKGVKLEGCLSLKDIWGVVHRAATVTLSFENEKGTRTTKTFDSFLATIIQHECDHLDGILFPKRVLEQNEKLYKAKADEKGEMIFEELDI